MEVKTRAIVLKTVKYGDAKMIVDMLTREVGRVSFICHLAKTNKGKIKKQLFQPLSILDIVFDNRPNTELQHLRDIRLAVPFTTIPFDPYKISISIFLAEFLTFATHDENDADRLENFVEESLEWLDNATQGFANFHLVFMMSVTLFIGFYPNIDTYAKGAWFDLREGTFSAFRPLHPDYLAPEEAESMHQLMRMSFDNMHLFRMSHVQRNKCTEVILTYYRLHVPNFPELKSFEVLKSMF